MNKEYPIKLAGQIFGNRVYTCFLCSQKVEGFDDKLSAQEFRISGMCQNCQNKVFKKNGKPKTKRKKKREG